MESNRPLRSILLALSALLYAAPLTAQARPAKQAVTPTEHPLLWRIDGLTTSYLYGTIHVADRRVSALPDAVLRALDDTSAIYTETPMDDEATREGTELLLLPPGETLDQKMPAQLNARLSQYLQSKGYSLQRFERLNLWAITVQATMLDEVAHATEGAALDQKVYDLAVETGKQAGSLESVDEQLGIFEMLTPEEHLEWLRTTLDVLERYESNGKNPTEELIKLYLAGDEKALYRHVVECFPGHGPLRARMSRILLERRNVRMANRISDKLVSGRRKSHFFAVGAGHLAGPKGILALLAEQGYRLHRIRPPLTDPTPQEAKQDLVQLLKELRDEVRRLSRRVDALEKKMEKLDKR